MLDDERSIALELRARIKVGLTEAKAQILRLFASGFRNAG